MRKSSLIGRVILSTFIYISTLVVVLIPGLISFVLLTPGIIYRSFSSKKTAKQDVVLAFSLFIYPVEVTRRFILDLEPIKFDRNGNNN